MLETLIAAARKRHRVSGVAAGARSGVQIPAADLSRLQALGFEVEQIEEAADEVGGDSGYDALLDWLCIHLEASQLPRSLRGTVNCVYRTVSTSFFQNSTIIFLRYFDPINIFSDNRST